MFGLYTRSELERKVKKAEERAEEAYKKRREEETRVIERLYFASNRFEDRISKEIEKLDQDTVDCFEQLNDAIRTFRQCFYMYNQYAKSYDIFKMASWCPEKDLGLTWISMEEKRPKDGEVILGCDEAGNMMLGSYFADAKGIMGGYDQMSDITHWMSAPKRPKRKEQ